MAAATSLVQNVLGVTGVNLIPLPTAPGFRMQEWSAVNTNSPNTSPYNGSSQILSWPGADSWNCMVTLPKMSASDAAQWVGAFLSLCGCLHAFQFGDQLYQGPQNTDAVQGSVPVVDATTGVSNAPGTYQIATRGWNPSAYSVMTAGDYLQIGLRYHRVTANANSDANGKAVLNVWPSLRVYDPVNYYSAPPDASPIDIVSPVGLFRLAEDILPWQSDFTRLTSFSFKCREFKG